MENKIATTIEQSKKLLELGIDSSTADMYWWNCNTKIYLCTLNDGDFNEDKDIPAWSISALLGLIPKEQHVKLILNAHYAWICETSGSLAPKMGGNPLDAIYEMIVYLKENKLI